MDPEVMTALSSLGGCIGWLTAVALLVVGLLPVRKVYPTAGYLIAGAGAVRWLFFCCESLPEVLLQSEQYELYDQIGDLNALLSMLMWLTSTGLVLGGLGVLARHISAKQAAGGAA